MQSVSAESDGRTELGRFAPGNRLGKGNANAIKMSRLRATLLKAVDPVKLTQAFETLQNMAVGGDLAALKLYLAYAIGKPTQSVEVTGAEGSPLGGSGLELREVILTALHHHPQAKIEVAARLRSIRDIGEDDR